MHMKLVTKGALLLAAAAMALGTAVLATGASATTRAPKSLKVIKVALVAPSATNDLAFTQSMYAALKALQSKYHFKLSVSANQFVVADAANIIRQYATEAYLH